MNDIRIFPAVTVTHQDDSTAVVMGTGIASLGMSIAEARWASQRLARAADEAEHRVDLYKRLRQERQDEPRRRGFEAQMEDATGIPATGPID